MSKFELIKWTMAKNENEDIYEQIGIYDTQRRAKAVMIAIFARDGLQIKEGQSIGRGENRAKGQRRDLMITPWQDGYGLDTKAIWKIRQI